jgi:hypothetical protein
MKEGVFGIASGYGKGRDVNVRVKDDPHN